MALPQSVLVTGARGFAGRHLVAALQQRGVQVVRGPSDGVDVDVTDLAAVELTLRRAQPRAIVHLAARTWLPAVLADPRASFAVNVGGTLHVLDAAAQHAPQARIIVVSSSTVYGVPNTAQLLHEDSAREPLHPYALQKLLAEALAERARSTGQDVLIARPFNHVGAGMQPTISLAHFARQLALIEAGKAEPRLLTGNLAPVRDFLPVQDVIDAYLHLLEYRGPETCFNIASGTGHSMASMLERLRIRCARKAELGIDPARLRQDDPPFLVGDASRLRRETGWQPRADLEATLNDILAEARQWASSA